MVRTSGFLWMMITAVVVQMGQAATAGLSGRMDVVGRTLLESRQTGTLPAPPPQCANDCTPIANILNVGCTAATCCTSTFANGFFNCFSCVGKAVNLTDYTSIQQTLDSFTVECTSMGLSVPKLTFPGQNPNRPLSSIPPTGTSTSAFPSTNTPGLPISTGPPASGTNTINSTVSHPQQSTVTSLAPTPTSPQSTLVSNLPTTTTATSSGARTISMHCASIVLVSSMVLTGLSFYFAL